MDRQKQIENLLDQGLSEFGLDIGIVSHIEKSIYVVTYCRSTDTPIRPGTQFELLDTYCADVVRSGKTRFYKDVASISEMLKHPCYLNTQLRSYIGTPVRIEGEIWGTVNYSSMHPHKLDYTKEEIKFLEDQARQIAELLVSC